jgi:hypothetical protein
MQEIKILFNTVCYNPSMSEKGAGLYSELSHPHTGDPRVDPKARTVPVKPRRKPPLKIQQSRKLEEDAMGVGFFPTTQPVATPEVPTITSLQAELPLRDRALRFEAGAPVYRVIYKGETDEVVIPRTPEQADHMFLGRLPIRLELPVDRSCLERGKRGDTVIKRVGKSMFGAFTIVHYPMIDEDGKEINVRVLADMNDRTSKENNEVIRFRREVSGERYYLSLPRTSSRKRS